MALSAAVKHDIARDFLTGMSAADIATKYKLSVSAFYRLRNDDDAYQEAEHALLEEIRDRLKQGLTQHAEAALQTLREVMDLDACNLTEGTGPNGGKTTARKIDPKIVTEKRLAADTLLSHWQRLTEHEEARRQWEYLNLSSYTLDDENDNDTGDEWGDAA